MKEDDVTEIGINRAIELIQKYLDERKELIIGIHPETKEIIRKKELKADLTICHVTKKITRFLKNMKPKKCHWRTQSKL